MGIQATMPISGKKNATVATIISGGATYPPVGNVRIVSLAEDHRAMETREGIIDCINYARDNDLHTSAGSVAIVVDINGRRQIQVVAIASNVVDGQVGIMLVGQERSKGKTMILDNAHRQLLDWVSENVFKKG